ncbi:MAG TPA: cyclic nucleotide-binding domain-containing protein [Polyangiaceae bacterium]
MMDENLHEFLMNHSMFRGLTPDHIDLLTSNASTAEYGNRHRVFTCGALADKFYIIQKGKVGVEIPAIAGAPLTIQTVSDGSVLGWSWLMPPYRWLFDARALAPSSIVVLDGERVREVCESDPKLGYELMKRFALLMAERLNAARQTAIRHYTGE